jgi:predicted 2-oxoglutarate/Fe(II)-dependent dioxygenase YbiX
MLETAFAPLREGDRAPPCYGMALDRSFYSSEEQYGRPAVLVLIGSQAGPSGASPFIARRLLPHLPAFAERNADVLLMVNENPTRLFGDDLGSIPIRIVDCGAFLSRCGVGPRDTLVLVLDRNLRIALRTAVPPELDIAGACLAALDALPLEPPRDVATPAPVIVLPNLLSRAVCRDLIALFDASPVIDGAVARVDAKGNPCSVVDHKKKNRLDLMIDADTDLHRMLHETLLDRCAPEIAKAFQHRVAYLDRILISRYDDTGGWFRRHRDNAAANVAFRQFAMSLNLNTGDYDGGHVVFPEYNDHRYRPPAGAGVIFSTGILHEATPVTKGHRYVLLTFLHNEAAETQRLLQRGR